MSAPPPARLFLAGAGLALAASLFLSWFPGVSGWEHWVWADVVLLVVAADLVAAALIPPLAAHRIVLFALCGGGIAVVLGHGFAPDEPTREAVEVQAGGYVALAALLAGGVAAVVPWPRRAGGVLLVAAAAGIVGALLSGWGLADPPSLAGQSGWTAYAPAAAPNGFERWHALDAALLALAAGLLLATPGRLPRAGHAVLAVAVLAAATCILIGARDQLWADEGVAVGLARGPLVALLALAAGVAGLALVRPRGPAARAG